jgi:hypothetical protein
MDIMSLYTNMPSEHVFELLTRLFEEHLFPAAEMILEMICFVLYHNILEFNGKFFLQIFGMAMGTQMAISIANIIYMGMLEGEFRTRMDLIGFDWPLFHMRYYINDILLIFQGSLEYSNEFLKHFNGLVFTIKCAGFG